MIAKKRTKIIYEKPKDGGTNGSRPYHQVKKSAVAVRKFVNPVWEFNRESGSS